jgi:hypothetical protein
MIKRLTILGLAAFSLTGLFAAPAANAAGTFCYDLQVKANGTSVVSQTGCQDLPV